MRPLHGRYLARHLAFGSNCPDIRWAMTVLGTSLQHAARTLVPSFEGLAGAGRVRLRTLVTMRWVAVAGQAIAVAVVHAGLGYELPMLPTTLLIAASVVVNLHASLPRAGNVWLGDRAAALYLAYDLVQLALLLGVTGGLANPFSLLILAPVTVSASVLSRTSTLVLSLLAVAAASVLAVVHVPLPWPGGLDLPAMYTLGMWLALVLAVLFMAGYVFAIAAEEQRMSDALAATQMALAREQRLSALGGLAAAAAHELGSPLGTITVVARELSAELPEDSPLREDAELLLQESARCKDILAQLARKPEGNDGGPYNTLPLAALAEAAAAPFAQEATQVRVTTERAPADETPEPTVPRHPEILHGIGTLVQNATRFAASTVTVKCVWSQRQAAIHIQDDGPGFSPDVLPFLGEPYISSSDREPEGRDAGEHMGLGVFIARTLLARTGASVQFGNRPEGGADVTVTWPRDALERARVSGEPTKEMAA
jgi:two-component system sensor histidine kinase RegB